MSSMEEFDPEAIAALETVLEECRDPAPTPRWTQSPTEHASEGIGGGNDSLTSYQCQILKVPSRQNQEMVELSLLRLANLAYRNDETQRNQRDVCADGGHMDILSVMSLYPHNVDIQKEAIGALANLAAYSPEAQSMIGNDRGVEHILFAMRTHGTDPKLQDDGCCALWILIDSNMPNALRLKREEGMKLVVQAMIVHSENDLLVQDACSLIENYCQMDPRLKRDVCKASGASALASVVENFRMDDETRRMASQALHRLTAPN
jgi:hypothetical protein